MQMSTQDQNNIMGLNMKRVWRNLLKAHLHYNTPVLKFRYYRLKVLFWILSENNEVIDPVVKVEKYEGYRLDNSGDYIQKSCWVMLQQHFQSEKVK